LVHDNIVRVYNTLQIDSGSFCTVLEFCEGPDLSAFLKVRKTLSEKEARGYIRQIVAALKYLFQNGTVRKVIHYDLKPQNILFHRGELKLADFGLCKIMNDEQS